MCAIQVIVWARTFPQKLDFNTRRKLAPCLRALLAWTQLVRGPLLVAPTIIKLWLKTPMFRAGPCYFGVGGPIASFSSDCAAFVDAVHTSVVGHNVPIGHVDFFVNGLVPVQPGCLSVSCSHERSWQFEFETIVPGQEDNFRAVKCASNKNIGAEACTGQSIRFGFGVPPTARGVYYVKANEQSPFGPFAKPGFTPVCAST